MEMKSERVVLIGAGNCGASAAQPLVAAWRQREEEMAVLICDCGLEHGEPTEQIDWTFLRQWKKEHQQEVADDAFDDWLTHVRGAWLSGELQAQLPEFKRQGRKIRGFRTPRLHEYLALACQSDEACC